LFSRKSLKLPPDAPNSISAGVLRQTLLGELLVLPDPLAGEEGADIKTVATTWQILRLKCTKFDFG